MRSEDFRCAHRSPRVNRELGMKRSELYEKVWATPMTRLAAELGISDVGLAKACRRHAIPVPPRGHWAKLQAGKKSVRSPLPAPELDVRVDFTRTAPEERARLEQVAEKQRELVAAHVAEVAARISVSMAQDLTNAHPLVKATQKYWARVPKLIEQYKRRGIHGWSSTKPEDVPPPEQHGRYSLLHRGLLDITASLEAMEWVLRFHATVFKGFTDAGMAIAYRAARAQSQSRTDRGPAVEAAFQGEAFTIRFFQGYRRVELPAKEVAALRKERGWASAYNYYPADRFTFTLSGTEYGCDRSWQGTKESLQAKCAEIVRLAVELAPVQAERRRQREAAAIEQQRRAEVIAEQQRRVQARAEQVKQARLILEALARRKELIGFLDQLETDGANLESPYRERLPIWIGVVRKELASRDPVREMLEQCLSLPSWSTWPPAWWPIDESPCTAADRPPRE